MSDSLASLQFAVNSSDAVTAAQNLQGLATAADRTTESQDRFNQHTQRFIAVAHDLSGSLAEMRRQYQQTSATIDQSVASLDTWQQRATQSAAAFSVFDEARRHVDALGASFGATSTAVQLFYDRATNLALNSGETTLALQRMTDAIQGQTSGGLAIRHDLDLLGVNSGSDVTNADQVLSQVVSRLRNFRDSPEKSRLAQEFGISDPDTLQSLSEPTYVPITQRRALSQEREDRFRIGEATRYASQQTTTNNLNDAQLTDLEGSKGGLARFATAGLSDRVAGLFGRYNLGNLSDEQSGKLASLIGLPGGTALGSQPRGVRLDALRYLDDHPDSQFSHDAETLPSKIGDYVRSSYVGREYRHLSSGSAAANEAAILADRQRLIDQQGYIPGILQTSVRQIRNVFDPAAENIHSQEDGRSELPQEQVLNDQTTGDILSGAGFRDVTRYQEAKSNLTAANDDVLKRFTGAYGSNEGQARFQQYFLRLQAQQRDALTPGIDQVHQAQRQQYIGAFPLADRAQASSYLSFAQSEDGGHADITPLIRGDGPRTIAGLYGSETITPKQREGFDAALGASRAADAAAAGTTTADTLDSLRKLAGAAAQGSDALERAKVAQDAYTGALNRPHGATPAQAQQAADNATRVFDTERGQAGQVYLSDESRRLDTSHAAALTRSFGQGIGGASGAAIARDGDTLAEYSEKLREFAAQTDKTNLRGLQQLIDNVEKFGTVAAQAAADAGNLSAARSLEGQSEVDRAVAAAPPERRAFIRAQGQVYQQNLTNPAISPALNEPTLDVTTQQQIAEAAARHGADPGMLAFLARAEGGGGPGNNPLQVTADTARSLGFAPPTNRADSIDQGASLLAKLQAMPALRGDPARIAGAYNRGPNYGPLLQFEASGDRDLSGYDAHTAQYPHGDTVGRHYVEQGQGFFHFSEFQATQDPATRARLAATKDSLAASAAAQDAEAQSAFTSRQSVQPTSNQLLSRGETGAAAIASAGYVDRASPIGVQDAARRVAEAQAEQQRSYATTTGEIRQQTEASTRLAEAYSHGYAAVGQATEKNTLYAETLQNTVTAQNEAARAAELHAEALAKINEAAAQQHLTDTVAINRTEFGNSLGIASDDRRAQAMSSYNAEQAADERKLAVGSPQRATFISDQQAAYTANQTAENLQRANQVFKELGDTILDTFSRGLRGGESFKHLVGDMFTEIGATVEKALLQKPLENFFQNQVGSLFGTSLNNMGGSGGTNFFSSVGSLIGGLLGLGGGIGAGTEYAGAAPFTAPLTSVASTPLFARGGAFVGGFPVRYHATGSIVNTPTAFQTADGGANTMGEAGNEAILPLQVMPNGNLGVATSGGGGSIMIHAPTTIQGGGGSDSDKPMDPQTAAKYQRHIERLITAAVNNSLVQQGRPGGILYQNSQN